jgi:hypothetical protein
MLLVSELQDALSLSFSQFAALVARAAEISASSTAAARSVSTAKIRVPRSTQRPT